MAAPDIPPLREIQLRRLSAGEIFDGATALLREQAGTLILLVALINLPLAALASRAPQPAGPEDTGATLLRGVVEVGVALVMFITWAGCALLTAERVAGQSPRPGDLLRRAATAWPGLLLTALLGGVIVLCLMLCLIVPGILFGVYYTFLMQAVVLRGYRVAEALDYSKTLVKGAWWRTLGISCLASLPAWTLGVILAIPSALIKDSLGLTLGMKFLSGLAEAFAYIAMTLLFLNAEALRQRAAPAAAAAPPPGAPHAPAPAAPFTPAPGAPHAPAPAAPVTPAPRRDDDTATARSATPPAWGGPPLPGPGGKDDPGPIYPP